ncbi:phosphopantothenoylcysteine decarboxylase subunit VHS3-like [Arachis duranensis]|uniref:Phosphopantothenoylcysteine decarboxylase subunit VHS3-like n=1 Tax=Arachis duranensis TaxID=130453 RepID=A0A9C6TBZ2_ARADU|nr:phosphopantothenoylcysteine decarboxylase subunit VHS3-like [Arachis hypogaea]XP_052113756.1 phosphopantothenoylcysteine decarboxylase subunit VHS3-like [Arachis duranensis]
MNLIQESNKAVDDETDDYLVDYPDSDEDHEEDDQEDNEDEDEEDDDDVHDELAGQDDEDRDDDPIHNIGKIKYCIRYIVKCCLNKRNDWEIACPFKTELMHSTKLVVI